MVESIEVEALVTNSRKFALEEDEIDLKLDLPVLDLAADFVLGFAVGLEVELGVILAVAQLAVAQLAAAQLAAKSEALEC